MNKGRIKWVGLWLLQPALALVFLQAGRFKVLSNPGLVEQFRVWGYPEHFYLLVGWIEVLGAFALLIPRTAGYRALTLLLVMIGALIHHLWRGEGQALLPGILILLLGLVAFARWPEVAQRR